MSNLIKDISVIFRSFLLKAWSIKYMCIRKGKGSKFALEIEAIKVFHYCVWNSNVAMILLLHSPLGHHEYFNNVLFLKITST